MRWSILPSVVLLALAAPCEAQDIAGTAFEDRNGDGIRGEDEPLLEGVTVELFGHHDSPAPDAEACYQPDYYVHCFEEIRMALGVQRWFVLAPPFLLCYTNRKKAAANFSWYCCREALASSEAR